MDAVSGFATMVWPPTGISLAALLIFGYRLWPGIALAALLVNFVTGAPFLVACGMALGNTLEAVVGVFLLKRYIGFDNSLSRQKDVIGFIVFACLISTLVSPTIGVTSLFIGQVIPLASFGATWKAWWIGDVLGDFIVAPLILTWATKSPSRLKEGSILEIAGLALTLTFTSLAVFGELSQVTRLIIPTRPFILFPFIIWAALRFGPKGSALAVFFTSVLAIWNAVNGFGPFTEGSLSEQLPFLHSFLVMLSFIGMILSSIIAERNNREKILRASDLVKSTLLLNSLDCIITMSQEGIIQEFNPSAEKVFGYSRDEAIGKEMANLIIPQRFREAHRQGLRKYLKTGEGPILNRRSELVGTHKNGNEIPVELTVTSVKLDDSIVFYGFLRDISERKKAIQDLLEAKENADAANMAKSAFLANMSHEIRTPLGAVLGFADLVVDPQVRPSEKANYIAAIKRNGELLSSIINDILDLSKIEAGKMQTVTHEVALIELLSDTKTLLDLQAKEKGIALNIAIDENVPEIISTDPLRLRQILINIIGNAIKFTSRGTVDVKIMLTNIQNGKHNLVIVVKDTGGGIGEDQIGKLFAPFSQADATFKRKFGGTGLGLVISKRFANLLGGDVSLTETALGKGSTFTITIDPGPLHAAVPAEGTKTKTVELGRKSLRLDDIKVLVAEDSPDNQMLISRLLGLAGATVDVASDGKEAVEKARKNHYDVLLMDLQMPIMDGYEATAKLRQEGYRGKIVALTAHTLREERERCLKSGFDEHTGKPVNRDFLIELVYRCSTRANCTLTL